MRGAEARGVTLESVVPYMLNLSMLEPGLVVDGAFRVEDHTRRNRTFKVILGDGGLLLKQPGRVDDPEARGAVATEAAILRAVAEEDSFAPLRWATPPFVRFEPRDAVLVVGLVHPATSLTKYHLNLGDPRFPEDVAATAGRLLADAHACGARALREGRLPGLAKAPPLVWSLLELDDAAGPERSRARAQLCALVRERAGFWRRLPELRRRWDEGADLVHGDVRWDNLLVAAGEAPGDDVNLRLIDWETAGRGDASWDVAAYLAEHLRFWIQVATLRGARTLDEARETAPFPLAALHPAVAAFGSAYAARRGWDAPRRAGLARAVADHLPFHLTQIACENVQEADVLGPPGLLPFQMALLAAASPEASMREWLGLEVA